MLSVLVTKDSATQYPTRYLLKQLNILINIIVLQFVISYTDYACGIIGNAFIHEQLL